jgi:hypothetical protein
MPIIEMSVYGPPRFGRNGSTIIETSWRQFVTKYQVQVFFRNEGDFGEVEIVTSGPEKDLEDVNGALIRDFNVYMTPAESDQYQADPTNNDKKMVLQSTSCPTSEPICINSGKTGVLIFHYAADTGR